MIVLIWGEDPYRLGINHKGLTMTHSFIGTDVYVAIPERGQEVLPLVAGDLVDIRVLARERQAQFAVRPGGRIHPIQDLVASGADHPEWPPLMFRALFVGESVLRIIEELPDWSVFGPRGKAVEDLIDQYLFLDQQGKASYHRVERIGRLEFRAYAEEEERSDGYLESIFDGTVYDGKYWMACRALYCLANSSCATGPLALAISIILRDDLGETDYQRLVRPYRAADIPFMERVE